MSDNYPKCPVCDGDLAAHCENCGDCGPFSFDVLARQQESEGVVFRNCPTCGFRSAFDPSESECVVVEIDNNDHYKEFRASVLDNGWLPIIGKRYRLTRIPDGAA